MAIVYVPGIGVRRGPREARAAARRAALLARYLGPLVRPGGLSVICQPTWGELGAPDDLAARLRVDGLQALGEAPPDGLAPFGLAEAADLLSEALSRGRAAPGRLAARPALAVARHCLRRPLTAAAGDLLLWLDQRRRGLDGPILGRVGQALAELSAATPDDDERLLLLGHSLGGVLLYEALARRPVSSAETWLVTVGCPLPLFAALGLSGDPPQGLARWLNVCDPADPLAFAAGRTWPQAEDWSYRTGALLWAHGGYLSRPSFYRRLAARLSEPARCR